MELTPILDLIIVEHLQPDVFRLSGGKVWLPNRTDGEPEYARVLKVGPGRANEYGHTPAPVCQVGDIVALYPKAGHPVKIGERTVHVVQPGNLMGVVTGFDEALAG